MLSLPHPGSPDAIATVEPALSGTPDAIETMEHAARDRDRVEPGTAVDAGFPIPSGSLLVGKKSRARVRCTWKGCDHREADADGMKWVVFLPRSATHVAHQLSSQETCRHSPTLSPGGLQLSRRSGSERDDASCLVQPQSMGQEHRVSPYGCPLRRVPCGLRARGRCESP